MLKLGIEKNLGHPVDHFEIVYIAEKNDLVFRVWTPDGKIISESYNGANKEMMLFAIKGLSKSKLKEDESLDVVVCEYNPDETLNLTICLTRGTEKIKHKLENYKP